jgi:6-hydroxycyclohex-1-ene-1-carbonyl-CoA dehydrogenase
MAFDATAFGSWGCPPELYPEAVELVCSGQVDVRPFIRHMPLDRIQEAFEITHAASEPQRIVLIPEE